MAEHGYPDELVEHDPVADAWPVTAQRVGLDMFWDQRDELVSSSSMMKMAGQARAPREEAESDTTSSTGAVPVLWTDTQLPSWRNL
ncbi:hypothetical protein [Nocardioides sp. AE5]|uniref:hypothetical protein n=1 Tax=Nocardioides sp. AE5 TaxID=2962573 RepID=UPI0037C82C99